MIPDKKTDLFLSICPKNEVQSYMLKAASKGSIRESDRKETLDLLNSVFDGIRRDLGIRSELEDIDKARLMDITLKYYSNLSVSEVKLAFEFLNIGELDNFLPKDRDGNADKNHYQFFSVEFYSRILRAYIRKKDRIKAEAPRKLLNPINKAEEAKYYNAKFNEIVREYYYSYIEKGGTLDIPFPFVILDAMSNKGLFDGKVLLTDEMKAKYAMSLIANMLGSKKQKYLSELSSGSTPLEIEQRLMIDKENEMIAEIFRKISESKETIEKYFP